MEKAKLDRLVRSVAGALAAIGAIDVRALGQRMNASAYDTAMTELDLALGECIDEVLEGEEPEHDLLCVHVEGPDDVIPAPDRETAEAWASRLNGLAAELAGRNPHPFDPKIEAVVLPWPYSIADHALGVPEEYAWLKG